MASAADLLNIARGEIGTRGGSKYWQDAYGWGGGGYAWCAVFVTDMLKRAGVKCPYFPNTFAFDLRDLHLMQGRNVDRRYLKAGDVVSFDWADDGPRKDQRDGKGDHVGFIEAKISDTVYQTIEGNTGGIVARRTRSIDDIIYGVRPFYSDPAPAPEPSKLDEDGGFGPKTKRAVQLALKAKGYYRDWDADGIWGWGSITSLQQYLRDKGYRDHDVTGTFGYWSTKDLQKHLRAQGFKDCDVTGKWGYYTTLALQKCLNAGRL